MRIITPQRPSHRTSCSAAVAASFNPPVDSVRSDTALAVAKTSAVQQADQTPDSELGAFPAEGKFVEWTDWTIDEFPVRAVRAAGREAAQRIKDVIPLPRLSSPHGM